MGAEGEARSGRWGDGIFCPLQGEFVEVESAVPFASRHVFLLGFHSTESIAFPPTHPHGALPSLIFYQIAAEIRFRSQTRLRYRAGTVVAKIERNRSTHMVCQPTDFFSEHRCFG
jgi:hypothetical protein